MSTRTIKVRPGTKLWPKIVMFRSNNNASKKDTSNDDVKES